jgi:hypothetical protein
MSDTPETNSIIRNAQAADHPPTRLAATLTVKCEKLERERDEARFLLKQAQSSLDAIHLEVGGWIKILKENTD